MYNLPLTILKNTDWSYTVLSNIFNIVTEWDTLENAIENWKEALECHITWLKPWDDEYEILNSLPGSFNTSVII
jgi:predicted RNase H-like HicB family nuclease